MLLTLINDVTRGVWSLWGVYAANDAAQCLCDINYYYDDTYY